MIYYATNKHHSGPHLFFSRFPIIKLFEPSHNNQISEEVPNKAPERSRTPKETDRN